MKFYTVTYDLRNPGRRYDELYDAIKNLAGKDYWQHPMESFWIIAFSDYSAHDANSIFQHLRNHIDDNDSILINKIDFTDYQGWMPKSLWDWVKRLVLIS